MSPAMSKADIPVGPTGWIIGTADSTVNEGAAPADTDSRGCLVAAEHVFRRPARAGIGQRNRHPVRALTRRPSGSRGRPCTGGGPSGRS